MKILFLIRSLETGGAQRQLALLASALRRRGHAVKIAVFYGGGQHEAELREAGVPVLLLRKRNRWDMLGFGVRLVGLLRRERPDILHGYMTVENILAGLAKPFLGRVKIVFGVRASDVDFGRYDRLRRLASRIETVLSRVADLIVVNSLAGRAAAAARGFAAARMVVIPNGIDITLFRPDPAARARVRSQLRIAEGEWVVGMVARFDPIKDHETFLRAAAIGARAEARLRFVCVGDGPPERGASLRLLAEHLGLQGRLLWTGGRLDVPALLNAFDVATSSSAGEGLPNALAEAMACGVPCVATDVGDTARLLADTGIVVPPRDPQALAASWLELLSRWQDQGDALAVAARRRIVEEFSLEAMVSQSERCFRGLLEPAVGPARSVVH